jgi:hypothetical protein
MSRALIVTIATLLAAPALADEPTPKPAPKAEPAPASGDPVAPPAHANGEHSANPAGERAPDLRANPRAGKPRDQAARRSGEAKVPVDAPAAKPAPCVEVKPCSID